MARFRFHKLVRDRIPDLMETKQILPKKHQLGGEDLAAALLDKMTEELAELRQSGSLEAQMDELADLLELIRTYAAQESISWGQIEARRVAKASARGAFKDGIFIESIEMDEENPEIATYRKHPDKFPEIG